MIVRWPFAAPLNYYYYYYYHYVCYKVWIMDMIFRRCATQVPTSRLAGCELLGVEFTYPIHLRRGLRSLLDR